MIDIEKLKPILEPLIEGRDDAASIIESISSIDEEVSVDQSQIDSLNSEWNERFKKAFFGDKSSSISTEIPSMENTEKPEPEKEYTYDNLFQECDD